MKQKLNKSIIKHLEKALKESQKKKIDVPEYRLIDEQSYKTNKSELK